jgi:hypothetical protein
LFSFFSLGFLPFVAKRKRKAPTFAKATADKARLTQLRLKRKGTFVAPAKLALHECKKALEVLASLPFFHLPSLYSARTVAAAATSAPFLFPAERPTFGRQAHLLRPEILEVINNKQCKIGLSKLLKIEV